ncbi:MAG: sulfatase-like hydrolase/transferase [Verrucomicrobiales bacterium]|nr:sulfatase-like hydrolase/transferase [Verrucomicrobiales bacterium]
MTAATSSLLNRNQTGSPGHLLLGFLALFLSANSSLAEPVVTSWFTDHSGKYARIYETLEDQSQQTPTTTWNRGAGVQALPTYAGVHEISYTATDVYIRTTGLGFHIMGPWYGNEEKTNLFPNYPANRAAIFRFPRIPGTPPSTKVPTGLGVIGYFVDGIAMFDSRDAFSFSNVNNRDSTPGSAFTGDGVWNRDAFVNESVTFDNANAHQAGANHHYHANPPGLRHLLGDSVDHDEPSNVYTENFNGKHSPILGWVEDGYPVYGPYGFSDPNDPDSPVRRMITGYQPRSLANGAARTSLPQWVVVLEGRSTTIAANQYGPNVSAQYPVGHYLEDYEYKGDVGETLGVDFDLDLHNGRFCKTPEFPDGTFAYFVAIESDGTPTYPYNIGRSYYGDPTGGNSNSIPAGATTYFEGGPERSTTVQSVSADDASGDIVLKWTSAEGGHYKVETSPDANAWTDLPIRVAADGASTTWTDGARANSLEKAHYRPRLDTLAAFDDQGFDYDNSNVEAPRNTIFVTLTSGNDFPPANLAALPASLTFNGQPAVLASRPSRYVIEIEVNTDSLADGSYPASATWPGSITWSGDYQLVKSPNILLLIVDDWGVDSSPIDNNATLNPGTTFATMANLSALAANGLRFTRAYAQPVCSPTRASLLTGRQAFRTGVGNPGDLLDAAETTLPDAFTSASSLYQLATFGKWHLGGNVNGYNTLGGWTEFAGITGGGVPEQADGYTNWTKNTNGTNAATTAYSTTDQVDDAKSFIDAREASSQPWFVWMGFNAPHTPFHEPPAGLLQGGTGTSNKELYQKALEALDTEIGRLLQSVDLATTNIILVGDNGTPAQVVQAPYGPTGGMGHSKGDLYEGGIHVPMVVRGPSVAVPSGSTTDKLVHVTDLFATILEMANIPVPAEAVDSTSITPILMGSDTAQRNAIAEVFGAAGAGGAGRSIRLGTYPDYKLIIHGNPLDTQDDPVFEFYHLATDPNENSPLTIANLTGESLDAYNAAIAMDALLGGGYSDPPSGPEDTLYIELPTSTGPASVPQNLNLSPTSITVDGVAASFVARVDNTETQDRYWVKCTVPEAPPYNSATVTFSDNPNTGDSRVFNSVQIIAGP